jgi:RNA polymerase sigma factor (sigma-70 family)
MGRAYRGSGIDRCGPEAYFGQTSDFVVLAFYEVAFCGRTLVHTCLSSFRRPSRDEWAHFEISLSKPDDPSLRLVELIQANVDREKNSERLFDIHWPSVVSYFRRQGFSQEESKDLTQDTFLRVFKGIDSFRRDSSFEWWLRGIAESTYKNEIRKRRAEKRDGIEQSIDAPVANGEGPVETLASPVPDSLAEAVKRQQVAALRAALAGLPEQMRRCCMLRYVNGLKYHEIAELMQISIETVKAHLFQGRKRLASMLGTAEKAGRKGGEDAT